MPDDVAADASSNPSPDATVAAMPNVTLPVFSTSNTAPWFQRAEALFRIKRVSANQRSDFIVGALPEDVFNRISSWLNTYADGIVPYDILKAKIIRSCQPSPEEKSQKILDLLKLPLGDQRPSDAFFELKNLSTVLAPDGSTSQIDLLRVLWMLRLPTDIRTQIRGFSTQTEEDLTEVADAIRGTTRFAYSNAPSTSAAAAATADLSGPPMDDDDDDDVIAAAQRRQHRPRRQPQRMQYNQQHNQHNHPSDLSHKSLCFYHKRFGREAIKCLPHCSLYNSKNM